MARLCPHLGMEGNRRQVYLLGHSQHRCYATETPEVVSEDYQSEFCLLPAHRRCPRLLASRKQAGERPGAGGSARRDATHVQQTAGRRPVRRGVSCVEVVVVGLVASIVLAAGFVGYAIWHRFQVGPGMSAGPVAGEAQPAAGVARATLVPTFTPTPLPTAPVAEDVPIALTAIPEPTLTLSSAAVRPPAQSPPTRLVIAPLGLDIPVLPVTVKTVGEGDAARLVWGDVPNAGGFHYTSAYPGNPGNTVINGHRDMQGAVFRHLDQLQEGDEIVLYVGEVSYSYYVTEIMVVPETFASARQRSENQQLIDYQPDERLTLVTCTPIGLATHRLLVVARPAEGP